MSIEIPEQYRDLLEGPVVVTLTTVSAEGKPHAVAVWRRWNGEHILITSDRVTRKIKNIQANPQVSVAALDPKNPYRFLEFGGEVVEVTPNGALEELNRHTRLYMGKDEYFGGVEPAEGLAKYDGVLIRIKPTRIVKFG
jgi:PPOX class probable F420-dependent enzyme